MNSYNRRKFLKNAARGGVSVTAGIAGMDLFTRRIFAEEETSSFKIAYRTLGSTNFKVSEIGFGAMNMRDSELVHAAIDYGINYIDTAHVYMKGRNEETIGQVMKTKRNKVFLTTKVGFEKPEKLTELMETSLKRLQTDYADLILLHAAQSRDQLLDEDIIKVFDSAKKKGLCRFVGVSTHTNQAEVLEAALESKFWEAALVGYNCISPPEVKTAVEKARKAGIAIIAMKNLLNPATWPWEPLKDIRKDKSGKMTAAQALIKAVLDDPHVDTTIPRITSFEQLRDDLAVMDMKMSFEGRRTLRRHSEAIKGKYCHGVAGCTGCRDQCPYGVGVSDLNRCISYAYGYGDINLEWENYRALPLTSRIEMCNDCSECVVTCINGINLTEQICLAKKLFT